MEKISGGYVLSARKKHKSKIADCPPHFREIWDYLYHEANHKDTIYKGQLIKRGQCIRSYKDIIEALSWRVGYRKQYYKKHHCEISMKWLMKEQMVTTTKTTRGMLITICNYDYYQDPENYESDNESHKKATRKRQWNDTINKNEKNEKNENILNTLAQKKPCASVQNDFFSYFWKAYPKCRNKGQAEKAFKKAHVDEQLLNRILTAIERAKKSHEWLKDDGQYIPYPGKWLNAKGWEDEVITQAEKSDAWLKRMCEKTANL
jgi:hypothetical protein